MRRFWSRKPREEPGITLGGVNLGPRPWLVLGGGGLKGLAHLGAWKVLRELGFEPAGILGTSIGALVGACIAGGRDLAELETEGLELTRPDIARVHRRALWVNGIRTISLFRGDVLRDYLASVLPKGGWEELGVRFQTNAVEMGTGRTEWFGLGARTDVALVDAIYASCALPVFYPPVRLPGGLYVDGGTVDALPLARAADLGATGIVAVDVGTGVEEDPEKVAAGGMLAIQARIFAIQSGIRRRAQVDDWEDPPLLYLRPKLEGYGTFDFEHGRRFLILGEEAAREALGVSPPVPTAP